MSSKYALIIGSTEYNDSSLPPLTAPGKDVDDLARVLSDPEICAFDQVDIVLNQPHFAVSEAIDEFFEQKKKDDLLVLYFSGHGIRDEYGALYLAFKNTNRFRLRSTAIKSDFIRDAMDQCRSKRQILILDCCNSGAFPHGTKGQGLSLGTSTAFNTGYGRIILTASDAIQYAWEGETLFGETENSLFTHFLVKGLQGDADHNGDGEITVDELYDYAFDNVKAITPKQTPSKFSSGQQGEILLRQLTEAQKEARRLQELEEKQRRERAETERLAAIRADEEAALKRAEELRISRENAEAAARDASERVLQEQAKLAAIQQEIAQRNAAREVLPGSTTIAPRTTRNLYGVAISAVIAGMILLIASYAYQQVFNSPESAGSLTAPAATNPNQTVSSTLQASATQAVQSGSSSQPSFYTAQPFSSTPYPSPMALEGTSISVSSQAINAQNAANVVPLARWGNGDIVDATYSPNGNTVAVATTIGIFLLDASDLSQLLFIETQRYMKGITFSPDGETITGVSILGDILQYRTADGSFLGGTVRNLKYVQYVNFSPDGTIAAIAASPARESVLLIRIADGSIIGRLDPDEQSSRSVETIRFSPNGKLLAVFSRTAFYLWNVETLELIRTTEIAENYNPELAFAPDGDQFAYIDASDASIKIINTQDGSLVQTMEGHDATPFALTFSVDGRQLYYAIGNGAIRVREIDTGTLDKSLQAHEQYVQRIVFSPDGRSFITISGDTDINLWDTSQSTLVATSSGYFEDVQSISISSDGELIAVSADPIMIRDISNGQIVQTIQGGYWPYLATFLSTGRTLMTTATDDSSVQFWNFENGQFVSGLDTFIYPYNNTATISPNQKYLASDTGEYTIQLTELDMPNSYFSQPRTLSGHTDRITDLTFSPDSTLLVSVSDDGTARLWNTSSGMSLRVFTDQLDYVNDAEFSPNGNLLATSSGDGTILLRRVSNNTIVQMIELPTGQTPERLDFSPNGQILAASTTPGNNILLFDVNTGQQLHTLSGHTMAVSDMEFTPDGKLLVSAGFDETIRVWGIQP